MTPAPLLDSLSPDWRSMRPPLLDDLRIYSREKLWADLAAAATVAMVSIPQAIGFALIAGLPATMVLASVIVGGVVAACFFSSRHVVFGPSNSLSLLLAATFLAHRGSAPGSIEIAIAIIQVEGELFFGAADLIQEHIRHQVERDDLRAVVLRLKSARHLDATAVFALRGLHDYLRSTGRHLLISGGHGDVLRVLRNSGLLTRIGRRNVFPAEPNPTAATKKALQRAQQLLGGARSEIRIYYDHPPALSGAPA